MEPKKRIEIVWRVDPNLRCIMNAATHESAAKNADISALKHIMKELKRATKQTASCS